MLRPRRRNNRNNELYINSRSIFQSNSKFEKKNMSDEGIFEVERILKRKLVENNPNDQVSFVCLIGLIFVAF